MDYVIIGTNGSSCPRCGRPTQIRKHREIGSKQLHQPYYYSQWFYCTNGHCKTTTYMQDEFIVWNDNPRGLRLRHLQQRRKRKANFGSSQRRRSRRARHVYSWCRGPVGAEATDYGRATWP